MGRRVAQAARMVGVDVGAFARTASGAPRYVRDLMHYAKARRPEDGFPLSPRAFYPIVTEFTSEAGSASGDYFFQDLWAARLIFARRPQHHVDVGSRLDGFVAHLLSFMPVEVVDIRPLESNVSGLKFVQDDATRLDTFRDRSVPSLSSLHAVEHFGLGRYGDPIAPDGWRRGMNSLERVLAPGGSLYFSVPVGRERLAFNAHRVFSPARVLETFKRLELVSFAAVDEGGAFVDAVAPSDLETVRQACGLFEFRKPD